MTTTEDGIVRYSCTRIGLIDTFRELPLTRPLHLYALGRLADSVMAGLPEVPADVLAGDGGLYRAVNDAVATAVAAVREGIAQMAEERGAVWIRHVPCGCGSAGCAALAATHEPFADLIREQP